MLNPDPLFINTNAAIPGTIIKKGINIFGSAPMSGVLRAAVWDSAAMALCTIRKLVHQYPNESTNPRPTKIPYHSTPNGLAVADLVYFHVVLRASGGNPLDAAMGA